MLSNDEFLKKIENGEELSEEELAAVAGGEVYVNRQYIIACRDSAQGLPYIVIDACSCMPVDSGENLRELMQKYGFSDYDIR